MAAPAGFGLVAKARITAVVFSHARRRHRAAGELGVPIGPRQLQKIGWKAPPGAIMAFGLFGKARKHEARNSVAALKMALFRCSKMTFEMIISKLEQRTILEQLTTAAAPP